MTEPRIDGQHFDVLIVGAGISGIAAAVHLRSRCPAKSWLIVEARSSLGGTWDEFRYPGVRSDSPMHSLAFSFRPWLDAQSLASGAQILRYLQQVVEDFELAPRIALHRRVLNADYDSVHCRWTVTIRRAEGGQEHCTCRTLYCAGGYYRYGRGYDPLLPGQKRFGGQLVHPQAWPEGLDCTAKRVVVIGSGATAISLAPSLVQGGAAVTVVQRSPSYVLPMRSKVRALAEALEPRAVESEGTSGGPNGLLFRRLRRRVIAWWVRWGAVSQGQAFYWHCRRHPHAARGQLLALERKLLGPEGRAEQQQAPSYAPWDQRLCVAADGDWFRLVREGRLHLVTDEVQELTPTGVQLRSGTHLPADVVVKATGLAMQCAGGMELTVDGAQVRWGSCYTYRGMLVSGVPNFVMSLGYANAAWTLKSEMTARYFCRLLQWMDRRNYVQFTPRGPGPDSVARPLLPLTSGYLRRSLGQFPRQGAKAPWTLSTNYFLDRLGVRLDWSRRRHLEFRRKAPGVHGRRRDHS